MVIYANATILGGRPVIGHHAAVIGSSVKRHNLCYTTASTPLLRRLMAFLDRHLDWPDSTPPRCRGRRAMRRVG